MLIRSLGFALVLGCQPGGTPAMAPQARSLAGHWTGTVELASGELPFELDLAADSAGWNGSITVPSQSINRIPLSGVTLRGDSVYFHVNHIPGRPHFRGLLAPGGRRISGTMSQSGNSMPFELTRVSGSSSGRRVDQHLRRRWRFKA